MNEAFMLFNWSLISRPLGGLEVKGSGYIAQELSKRASRGAAENAEQSLKPST